MKTPPIDSLTGASILMGNVTITVGEKIASGGYGFIYKSIDVRGKEYALKALHAPDERVLRSIEKEYENQKKVCTSPFIVSVYSHNMNRKKNNAFILMEYCTENLVSIMNKNFTNRFDDHQIVEIFESVCSGVYSMHTQIPPIIHRDLKIENILVNRGIWKLCDFGSSTTQTYNGFESQRERDNASYDIEKNTTMSYRSPEMIDLHRNDPIDQKSDIWALGCILYKLCTFKDAFNEGTNLQILNVKYQWPDDRKYNENFKKLVAMCFNPDPRERPSIIMLLNSLYDFFPEWVNLRWKRKKSPIQFFNIKSHVSTLPMAQDYQKDHQVFDFKNDTSSHKKHKNEPMAVPRIIPKVTAISYEVDEEEKIKIREGIRKKRELEAMKKKRQACNPLNDIDPVKQFELFNNRNNSSSSLLVKPAPSSITNDSNPFSINEKTTNAIKMSHDQNEFKQQSSPNLPLHRIHSSTPPPNNPNNINSNPFCFNHNSNSNNENKRSSIPKFPKNSKGPFSQLSNEQKDQFADPITKKSENDPFSQQAAFQNCFGNQYTSTLDNSFNQFSQNSQNDKDPFHASNNSKNINNINGIYTNNNSNKSITVDPFAAAAKSQFGNDQYSSQFVNSHHHHRNRSNPFEAPPGSDPFIVAEAAAAAATAAEQLQSRGKPLDYKKSTAELNRIILRMKTDHNGLIKSLLSASENEFNHTISIILRDSPVLGQRFLFKLMHKSKKKIAKVINNTRNVIHNLDQAHKNSLKIIPALDSRKEIIDALPMLEGNFSIDSYKKKLKKASKEIVIDGENPPISKNAVYLLFNHLNVSMQLLEEIQAPEYAQESILAYQSVCCMIYKLKLAHIEDKEINNDIISSIAKVHKVLKPIVRKLGDKSFPSNPYNYNDLSAIKHLHMPSRKSHGAKITKSNIFS